MNSEEYQQLLQRHKDTMRVTETDHAPCCHPWRHTIQICETLMSTHWNKCGVSGFEQGWVAGGLVRTRLKVAVASCINVFYDSVYPIYLETLCVHSDVSQIFVVAKQPGAFMLLCDQRRLLPKRCEVWGGIIRPEKLFCCSSNIFLTFRNNKKGLLCWFYVLLF